MNKGELITAIAKTAKVTQKDDDAALAATLEAIMEAVAAGEKVALVSFGMFEPCDRQAREGHNPQTGKTMKILTTKIPAFSPGKVFKEKLTLA